MKILYLCTSIDSYLEKQVLALQKQNHNVDILDIITYKMYFNNGKTIHIRPKTKFKVLEHFFVLDEINEQIRRKEIFKYLDIYDVVNIYKCSEYAVDLKEKIEGISLKYSITPNDIIPKRTQKLKNLYEDAKVFIFENDRVQQLFNQRYGYEHKSKTLKLPIEMIHIYENLHLESLEKLSEHLSIDSDKKTIFCHFNGSIHKQKELIISLANLPIEIKKASTFLLYMDNEDKIINQNLLLLLKDIKLDYIVVSNKSTDEQLAMLLKLSCAGIFINHSPLNHILITALYAKNHIFLFKDKNRDRFFNEKKLFLDDFSEFYFMYEKDEVNESLIIEVLKQNRQKIYDEFSYQSFEERYISYTIDPN